MANLFLIAVFWAFYSTGILIPGPWSKETMLLILIALSLVARSASDIWMIQSVTMIESTIIQMDRKAFMNTLFKYCAALPLVLFLYLNGIKNDFQSNNSFFLISRFQW